MTKTLMDNERLFNGRERIVREIVQGVLAEAPASFSLVGSKLVGKTRLLQFLAAEDGPLLGDDFSALRPAPFLDAGTLVVVHIDSGLPDAQTDFMAYVCDQVTATIQREHLLPQAGAPDGSQPLRLMTLLRRLNERGYRPILLLDSFDRVFTGLPMDTVNELRPLTRQAAVVVATEQPLIDLDTDRASSPLFNMMTQLFIGLLEPIAARRWLEDYAEGYPGILPCLDELLVLTGTHPYLLRGMGESLQEVERMLPSGAEVGPAHLPLLRLRLAERARPLFETLWRRLQTPPALVQMPVVIALLNRLVQGPLPVAKLSHEESNAVNWIFNLALIALCSDGGRPRAESSSLIAYELFSPLLAEFLRERLSDLHAGYTEAHAAGAASAVSAAAQPANVPPAGVAPAGVPEGSRTAARQEPAPAPVGIAPDVLESLTKIEAALLGYFQSRSNQIITPEQLLRDVWRRPDATVRRVQEAIRRLRLVIDAANPPIGAIENDRGRGYRFVPAPRA